MNAIGFLLIALMGADDWQTREFATKTFDYCCHNELISYEVERAAYFHKDLEIQHRAEVVLEKYYVLDNNGRIDITYRIVETKHHPTSREFAELIEQKKIEGWKLQVYFLVGDGTVQCRFLRAGRQIKGK